MNHFKIQKVFDLYIYFIFVYSSNYFETKTHVELHI